MKTIKAILSAIPYIFIIISVALLVQLTISVNRGTVPHVFNRAFLVVSSDSMEDTIMTDDLIFIDVDAKDYQVGDIITFQALVPVNGISERLYITHRIVDIENINGTIYYTTKGDNVKTNPVSADWETKFTQDKIIGKYTGKSDLLGKIYITLFPQDRNYRSYIFMALIGVFISIVVFESMSIVKSLSSEKAKNLEAEKARLVEEAMEKLRKQQKEKEDS